MIIPIPIYGKDNLCISITKNNGIYSVMFTELTDNFGYPVSAENCLYHNEETIPNLLPEYGSWKGENLEELIQKACKELSKEL